MSWFKRLFDGGRTKTDEAPAVRTRAQSPYFAIIDVETTGLSPKRDRVLELAVVRIDQRGQIVDEWSTRFNPEAPVGATHIHGITEADVAHAPLFRDVASSIVPYISGLPIAAHNARFGPRVPPCGVPTGGVGRPVASCILHARRQPPLSPEPRSTSSDRLLLERPSTSERRALALGDARATAGLLRHSPPGSGASVAAPRAHVGSERGARVV
ncbi:hypothetical protein CTI14_14045, partial [Methylobacterium radiotolerans]